MVSLGALQRGRGDSGCESWERDCSEDEWAIACLKSEDKASASLWVQI